MMSTSHVLLLECRRKGSVGNDIKSLLASNALALPVRHEFITNGDNNRARQLATHSSVELCFLLPNGFFPDAENLLLALNAAPAAPPSILVVDPEDDLGRVLPLASDFLMTPLRSSELISRMRRWSRSTSENAELTQLKEKMGLRQLIGTSPVFASAVKKVPVVARSDATVMILGETGTGKEVFARAIHYLGRSAGGPFVPVNCGAIPSDLLENELFGHAAGAYTSATSAAAGLIQQADGGTLFLDEIDALPLPAQVKLLRFVQDKEFRPLGAQKTIKANVRVIAATNGDLQELVKKKLFRQDLYYRLNVLNLDLPPLRDRAEDIPSLASHFLSKLRERSAVAPKSISTAALRRLQAYRWPGNVRELENAIEGSAAFCDTDRLEATDIRLLECSNSTEDPSFHAQKAKVIADFEEAYLRRVLAAHAYNVSKAATAAGKDRRSFWELLRKYDLHRR